MKYEDIEKVNSEIQTTDIKGKAYSDVAQRITAFRKLFPLGTIETELISIDNGVCVIKASIFDETKHLLGTGYAYEKENSTFINKTSYIENCETSAVGRALGMVGIGSNASICSAEEVQNAINNQEFGVNDLLQGGKHNGKTLKQVYEEDESYIKWLYSNKPQYTKAIEEITGWRTPTEEEQKELRKLMEEMHKLLDETNTDREKFYSYFGCKDYEMKPEQIKKAVEMLKEKKDGIK